MCAHYLANSGFFFHTFSIKVVWYLQFLGYLRTLSLKFQKATSKIEVFLSLPCCLSQTANRTEPGKTSILVLAFWNFKLKVLKYPSNCRLQDTLNLNFLKPLYYILQKCEFKLIYWELSVQCKLNFAELPSVKWIFFGYSCKFCHSRIEVLQNCWAFLWASFFKRKLGGFPFQKIWALSCHKIQNKCGKIC